MSFQTIGAILDSLLFIAIGVYGLWFHSGIIEAKIETGKLPAETRRWNKWVRLGAAGSLFAGVLGLILKMMEI